MIDVDNICMLYRRAYADKNIISIISTVHSLNARQVREILIENKLMTAEGEYIAPVRLTGKEYTMAQWKWMPHRKKQYDQLVAEGKSQDEIAEALGCDVAAVKKYADSLLRQASPVRTRKVPKVDPPTQEMAAAEKALPRKMRSRPLF